MVQANSLLKGTIRTGRASSRRGLLKADAAAGHRYDVVDEDADDENEDAAFDVEDAAAPAAVVSLTVIFVLFLRLHNCMSVCICMYM